VPACTLEAGWVGGCTTNVVAGVLQFSGVNKSFATLSGADGIKVGSFDIIARSVAAGTLNTTISGQIVEVRQANAKVVRSNSPFIAGGELNFDVDTGARRRRRQLLRDFRRFENPLYYEKFPATHSPDFSTNGTDAVCANYTRCEPGYYQNFTGDYRDDVQVCSLVVH